MKSPTKLKSAVLNLCLFTVSVFVCLALIEVILQGRYNAKREAMAAQKSAGECSMPSGNKQLIYTFIPGKCGHNSKGYRDYEHHYTKGSNVFRIIVIGDSVAQGQGVELDQSFPKVLETKINALISGEERKVEVITLARSGYTTSQELVVLEQEAFLYSPDIILWSYVLNDPAHPYYDVGNPMGMYHFQPRFYTVDFLNEVFVKSRERMMRQKCDPEYHIFVHCVYWKEVESNLESIAKLTSEQDTPVMFLIHPVFKDGEEFSDYPLTSLHAQLTRAASKNGIQVLDLIKPYSSYSPVELAQKRKEDMIDPWHPNRLGNEVAADFVFAAVRNDKTFRDWAGKIEMGVGAVGERP